MNGFKKRFYTPGAFFRDVADAIKRIPGMVETSRSGRVGHSFAEKIMLVVTQVNGCRYCSYGHSLLALRSGMSEAEIEKLLALEVGHFPEEEAVALAFAQHYAERAGLPDPDSEQRLRDYYGPDVSRDIMNYIRMISIGNLAGNTVDAFFSRLRGQPAENSNPLGELFLFVLLIPFVLPIELAMAASPRRT